MSSHQVLLILLLGLFFTMAWSLPAQPLNLENSSSEIQQLFRKLVEQVQKLIAEFLKEFKKLSGQ
nr:uncharacterized protein LOC122321022 [Drosophila bipectinata]